MATKKKRSAISNKKKPDRAALLVMGMHRSGTSALAGVLGHMGADLPRDLMAPAEMNAKGFFESNRITQLNEDLLASEGFTWWDFRRFTPEWFVSPKADEFADLAAETLAAEYGKSGLFVMKDPRICRLAPFWLPVLRNAGCRPLVVHTHRHPLDVARSLDRWADYEPSYSLLLWLRHVLDAEAETRGETRVFTGYDRLLTDWSDTMEQIGSGLGLHWPRSIEAATPAVTAFLSKKLQHFSRPREEDGSNPVLSEWIQQAYAILERWASDGENPTDYAVLDSLRAALDAASPSFSQMMRRGQELRHEAGHLRERCDDLAKELASLRTDAEAEKADLAEREAEWKESDKTREHAENELHQVKSALTQRSQESDDLHRELKATEDRLSELEKILEEERRQRVNITHKFERESRKLTRLTAQMTARMERDLEARMADRRAENETRRKLSETENELAAVQDAAAEEKAGLISAQAAVAEEKARLEAQVASLYNSTSWRITAPLRSLSRRLRRLRF